MSLFFAQNANEGLGYGYLYNWYSASDANFAPTDWKVPDVFDMADFRDYLIANNFNYDGTTTGNKVAKSIASDYGWDSSIVEGAVGNTDYPTYINKSNFTLLASGFRDSDGSFSSDGVFGTLWGSSESNVNDGNYMDTTNFSVSLNIVSDTKKRGRGVRLLYTGSGTPTSVTDYDGNIYDVVLIGSQYWTIQNWKSTTLNNGTAITKVMDNTTWSGLTTGARCAYNNNESNV